MIIPGAKAAHAVISDNCRDAHGDEGAFDEAVRRLREEYLTCLNGWKGTPGVQFHLVLNIESPRHRNDVGHNFDHAT